MSGVTPKLLVLKDACTYGGFGKKKAYRLIRAGKIDAYKMEGRVVVDRATVDRYLASLPKVGMRPRS